MQKPIERVDLSHEHKKLLIEMLRHYYPNTSWMVAGSLGGFHYTTGDKDRPIMHLAWFEACMTVLPQAMGDWHYLNNWTVTKLTAKKPTHPVDYLYSKHLEYLNKIKEEEISNYKQIGKAVKACAE
jgi:hypothetical protein